jgi:hypothetical protein
MQPTLNPVGCLLKDVVLVRLIRKSSEVPSYVGRIVFAVRKERRLVKRLVKIGGEDGDSEIPSGQCWLQSDAGSNRTFYDSTVFGPVPFESVQGTY